jgi:hypothetical protein
VHKFAAKSLRRPLKEGKKMMVLVRELLASRFMHGFCFMSLFFFILGITGYLPVGPVELIWIRVSVDWVAT